LLGDGAPMGGRFIPPNWFVNSSGIVSIADNTESDASEPPCCFLPTRHDAKSSDIAVRVMFYVLYYPTH
jgi:hypothetical protein